MENVIQVSFNRELRITSASRVEQTLQRATELAKLSKGDFFTADGVKVFVMDEKRNFQGRKLLLASKGEQAWVSDTAFFAALPEHFA